MSKKNMMISGDPPDHASDHIKRLYPGEQSLPLTHEGVQVFKEAACDGDLKDRLIGEGILLTGLKPGTLAHVNSEWLERDGERVFIQVPGGKSKCNISPGRKGRTRVGGGEPCRECRNLRDGYWSLNGTLNPRRIPIPEPEFADFIESYFRTHDRLCTPGTVNHRIGEIGKRAGFKNRVSGSNLRTTFGKTLAEKNFNGEIIRRIMGFSDTNQGCIMTQRYFTLSEEHDIPPYYCNEEIEPDKQCSRNVFFPSQRCEIHNSK